MADKKVLVRHPTEGHMQDIPSGDTATAPAFKATNTTGTTIDASGGRVGNVGTPTAGSDATNKTYVDGAVSGRVPTTRTISAGAGLTGGGELSSDVTLAVGAGSGIIVAADTVSVNFPASGGSNGTLAQAARADHNHDGVYQPAGSYQAASNELTGLASLADTPVPAFIKKTGNGTYELDPSTYLTSIPTASATVLGGVKVGERLEINAGVLSVVDAPNFDGLGINGTVPGEWLVQTTSDRLSFIGHNMMVYSEVVSFPKIGTADQEVRIFNNKVWHEGNDGAGSGLDADLLDGKHASDFAPAVHTHDNVQRTVHTFVAGENLDTADVVAVNFADGKVYKAKCDDATRQHVVGMMLAPCPADGDAQVIVAGLAAADAGIVALANGQYFIGTTAGALSASAPSSGRWVRVGYKVAGASGARFTVQITDFGEV